MGPYKPLRNWVDDHPLLYGNFMGVDRPWYTWLTSHLGHPNKPVSISQRRCNSATWGDASRDGNCEDPMASYNPYLHPGKLTCPLKRDQLNRKYIFQPLIFRGHVSFRGSKNFKSPYLKILKKYTPRERVCFLGG